LGKISIKRASTSS